MMDILSIGDQPIFDDGIVELEIHTYNLYDNTTLDHIDGIRIPI